MSEIKCQRIVQFMQTTEVEKTDRQDEIWSLEPEVALMTRVSSSCLSTNLVRPPRTLVHLGICRLT